MPNLLSDPNHKSAVTQVCQFHSTTVFTPRCQCIMQFRSCTGEEYWSLRDQKIGQSESPRFLRFRFGLFRSVLDSHRAIALERAGRAIRVFLGAEFLGVNAE